jgi:hypothetical protein
MLTGVADTLGVSDCDDDSLIDAVLDSDGDGVEVDDRESDAVRDTLRVGVSDRDALRLGGDDLDGLRDRADDRLAVRDLEGERLCDELRVKNCVSDGVTDAVDDGVKNGVSVAVRELLTDRDAVLLMDTLFDDDREAAATNRGSTRTARDWATTTSRCGADVTSSATASPAAAPSMVAASS